MLTRLRRGSLVCALLAAGACMVQETPDEALSSASADNAGAEMAGVLPPPADVACTVARQDTIEQSDSGGGEIKTDYAHYIYPAGAYNGNQRIRIHAHPDTNGVRITPPPRKPAQLLLNYQMCPGPGNPDYYYHIGNDHLSVRKLDTTWLAGIVVGKDFDENPSQASLLPSLQITADTSAIIRGGFVIVSN